jgi:hypothetical protein
MAEHVEPLATTITLPRQPTAPFVPIAGVLRPWQRSPPRALMGSSPSEGEDAMYQRTWSCRVAEPSSRSHTKPWILIEDPSPVAEVSDHSLFRQAGFEVAVCTGPDGPGTCPLIEGERCALAETADAVLFGLDLDERAGRSVLRAHLHQHPETPLVVEVPRHSDVELPHGATTCTALPSPASVAGQTGALWKALCTTGWGRPE